VASATTSAAIVAANAVTDVLRVQCNVIAKSSANTLMPG
jgi:hypothetical protein